MTLKEKTYSIRLPHHTAAFRRGLRDGIPIGLGYFAVSFSLGLAAKGAGITPFQGFLASLLCNTSTGEHAVFELIGVGTTLLEIALVTLVINARYLLMSCAMSQRIDPKMPFWHRLLMAYDLSDELFGIAIAQHGTLNPYYTYGATMTAAPGWAVGTALGIVAGNLLPAFLVNGLSVALYGMFLAVCIPPARKDRVVAGLIAVCFVASYASRYIPFLAEQEGLRIILLTVVIASVAALLFPRREESEASV